MSEAIKTISLDDIGDLSGDTNARTQAQGLVYSPKYVASVQAAASMGTDTGSGASAQQSTLSQSLEGATGYYGTTMTRLTVLFKELDQTNLNRLKILIVAFVIALGGLGYLHFTAEPAPDTAQPQVENLQVPDAQTQPEQVTPVAPTAVATTAVVPAATETASKSVISAADNLINPYWSLPNPLSAAEVDPSKALLPSDEERWRTALSHPYPYQHFKAVQEIRKSHLKGAEYLLSEVLSQPKFWTRMEALLAMAELGQEVDIDTVEGAIGDTRRALVQNYFRRFRVAANPGELYIQRQALRIVDAQARLVILNNLAGRREPTNDLYLIAASYDPNPRVKTWAEAELKQSPAAAEQLEKFQQIIAGNGKPEVTTPAGKSSDAASQDLKIEEIPPSVNVEEVYFLDQNSGTPAPTQSDDGDEPQNDGGSATE